MSRLLTVLVACSLVAADEPPPLKREFRGVWVATVSNIDWPSRPGLSTADQRAELLAILDEAKALNLNAVIFQVRPMADALYESKLEPWSEYLTGESGKSPGYDPLAFVIHEAHGRGLELHAWFNPYRARHPSAKSPATADHITRTRSDLAKPYGTHHWMNPTNAEVADKSLAVILDVVKRYDVDGVHIDDYFYPYKEKDAAKETIPFPDDDTWAAYQKSGGKLSRDDWRRDAVNRFVERMYKRVKEVKPSVKVGISPFGIWRPGYPKGIAGLDQYQELYADAKLWLNEGWVDYYSPQLYWPIAQEKQSFPKLLGWWAGENTKKRHLWPGLFTSRAAETAKGWSAKEVADQIALARDGNGATGVVHFSMKAFLKNTGGVTDAVKGSYAEPALVPETPWLATGKVPAPPTVTRDTRDGKPVYKVKVADDTRFLVTRWREEGTWLTSIGAPNDGLLVLPASPDRAVFYGLDRAGRLSDPVVGPK